MNTETCMKFQDISMSNTVYSVFGIFMSFVGCKGWEVDTENHRNGNNLWSGSENDRISHKRKSSSRVSMYFLS